MSDLREPWLRVALESKTKAIEYLEHAEPGPLRRLVEQHVKILSAAIDTLRGK